MGPDEQKQAGKEHRCHRHVGHGKMRVPHVQERDGEERAGGDARGVVEEAPPIGATTTTLRMPAVAESARARRKNGCHIAGQEAAHAGHRLEPTAHDALAQYPASSTPSTYMKSVG